MTNVENEKNRNSSHEFNLYADKHLQGQLLQVDEDSDIESYENKLSKSGSNVKVGTKQSRVDGKIDEITGWFSSAKFVARKPDGANNVKADQSKGNSFIHPWKDYRNKKEDSFVFNHYSDYQMYMEQYRNEHGCYNSRFPSGHQYGDSRRIAFQVSLFIHLIVQFNFMKSFTVLYL